jgi:hypothetical protein
MRTKLDLQLAHKCARKSRRALNAEDGIEDVERWLVVGDEVSSRRPLSGKRLNCRYGWFADSRDYL